MIAIQDRDRCIIAIEPTLPKAMIQAGIRKVKYSYIRKLFYKHPKNTIIKYKEYYLSKW